MTATVQRTAAGLRLDDVAVVAGATRILDGVSLEVDAGRVLAVVGANGAGKTTLLDAISGVAPGQSGTVSIGGSTEGGNGKRRAGVGRVFQGSPLPETMTVAEVANLVTHDRTAASTLLKRFGLAPHASTFVAELSTGMRRILDLAVATVGQPSVLLLDEPASGLAQSEIDHLASIVRRWRDYTGAVVILVEHDVSLVKALADEILVLEAGAILERGSLDEVLGGGRAKAQQRIRSPHDDRFRDALDRVAAGAVPTAALPKRTLSKWTLLRLGLREMSAGMASVMILGVLSRVLHFELGVSLGVVTAILASYNLASPFAVAIGHRSDTRPIFGRRRAPYIVGGAIVTGLSVAAAPHVAGRLGDGIGVVSIGLSLLLFVAMGAGMYGAGTAFFALMTEMSTPRERGHTASVVYLELMVGVLLGVILTGVILKDDAGAGALPPNIGTLFAIVGVLIVVLSIVAVWGQEKRVHVDPEHAHRGEPVTLRSAVRTVASMPQARLFFVFMVLSTLFLFLQQGVLASFGADVLHLPVRATSMFQAMMVIGTIAGMTIAGRPFAEAYGQRRIATIGLVASVIAFGGLAAAASLRAAAPVWLSILLLGLASGLFNVSTLALMMGMSDRRRTALFMGAWTLAHALADGLATAGGGVVFEGARRITHSISGGYGSVFAIEAIGLALCLPLLRAVSPEKFMREAGGIPLTAGAEVALLATSGVVIPATEDLPEEDVAVEETPTMEAATEDAPATPKPARAPRPTAKRVPAKRVAATSRVSAAKRVPAKRTAKSPVKKTAARRTR